MDLSATEYNMFFSLYSLPNIILALFSGYFADKFGRRIALIIFTILVVAGQLFFAAGVQASSFPLSALGRFIFGIGAESYTGIFFIRKIKLVVTLESLSYWNYAFLPFSMAAQTSSEKIGNALNDILLPSIYENTGNLASGFWIGFCFSIICLSASIFFIILEYWVLKDEKLKSEEQTSLSGIFKFPPMLWLLTFYGGFLFTAYNSFSAVASKLIQTRFNFDTKTAGLLIVFF